MVLTLEKVHSKEKNSNRHSVKTLILVKDNVDKMHKVKAPVSNVNGFDKHKLPDNASNSTEDQPDINNNTEKPNFKSILKRVSKTIIKEKKSATDSALALTEPAIDTNTKTPVKEFVTINKSVSKRHKHKKTVHVVGRIKKSKSHKNYVHEVDSDFEQVQNSQTPINNIPEIKPFKDSLIKEKEEDDRHKALMAALNDTTTNQIANISTRNNMNNLKKSHLKKHRIKKSVIKCKSSPANHRDKAIKPIPAVVNNKKKQEIKEFIKTDSSMEWELIQDWIIAEENYLNTCSQVKKPPHKKDNGNKKHQNKELLIEESYERRRNLFKNIWHSASQEDTAQSDIANKPKAIKTLREDQQKKPKLFYEHRKKEKIKTLKTICKNIMDYCDQQEEDNAFYEQISALQESNEPKEEVVTKNKKKKRKKIRACASTESEKKVHSILFKARRKALRFSKTHHTSACTKALLGSIIAYEGKDKLKQPTVEASSNSLLKIIDKKRSSKEKPLVKVLTSPRIVPTDYLHHSLKATKVCTEIGRAREALYIPKMMITQPLSYKFKSNESSA